MKKADFKTMFENADNHADLKRAVDGLAQNEMIELSESLLTVSRFTPLNLKQETILVIMKLALQAKNPSAQIIKPDFVKFAFNGTPATETPKDTEKRKVKRFVAGKIYTTRSACDHNCIFSYKIVRRSAKSVWIINTKDSKPKERRKAIEIYNHVETFYPSGKYSMAAIIRADK